MHLPAPSLHRLGRVLPRGYGDFTLQLAIWFGFLLLYQLARGIADDGRTTAFANGAAIIDVERRLGALVELPVQQAVLSAGDWLVQAVNWTYWNSQFTVVGLALLWVYFRRNDAFLRLRNVLLLGNLLALVGFVLMPTAPPRLFPTEGFVDTLAASSTLNHGTGLVQLASNQYAAMPSIHAADALILGVVMAGLVHNRIGRLLWMLWPAWVWFTVMATGNHYWLDVAAGVALAAVSAALVTRLAASRRRQQALDPAALP